MSRLWTGLLWLPAPTVDGRTIRRGALRFDGRARLMAMIGQEALTVGAITNVWQVQGAGMAVGWADDSVAPGVYQIGIDVAEAETEITGWENWRQGSPGPDVIEMTINSGQLRAVTILAPGGIPAWPGAEIRVHEVKI